MAEQAYNRVSIRVWPGMVSNKSPLARKPGEASVQVNCRSLGEGVLEVRGGSRGIDSLDGLNLATADIKQSIAYSLFPFVKGLTTYVVVHLASQRIAVLENPS